MLINPTDEFSTSDALRYYAISMQGLFGDNHTPQPSWLDLVERLKWNAWTAKKGMDRHEARVFFIKKATEVLAKHGYSAENPDKAKINAEYE